VVKDFCEWGEFGEEGFLGKGIFPLISTYLGELLSMGWFVGWHEDNDQYEWDEWTNLTNRTGE
jgi:hypothetical protein